MTQRVSAEVLINMPRTLAWEKLRDISVAHHYVPGIVKTEIVSTQTEGPGASRYVYRNAKSYLQETVEEWDEGSGFLIRLHKGDKPAPPFKSACFRYALAESGPDQTLLTTSLQFTLPWGSLGAWLEKRMLGVVRKTIDDVACSMKLYYETGRPTDSAALKAYRSSIR